CYTPTTGGGYQSLSNGNGTFSAPITNANWCTGTGNHVGTGDFNGDGKTDLYCYMPSGAQYVNLSNGDGTFGAGTRWGTSFCPTGSGAQFGARDFDGDGMTDFFCRYTTTGNELVILGTGSPMRVATVTNGFGGTITFGYTPSSAWVNNNNPAISQTVTSITRS